MTQENRKPAKSNRGTLLRLSLADFRRDSDGSWITTRPIIISGPGGKQTLVAADRRFAKGQMFMLGLDLAAVLERQWPKEPAADSGGEAE